MKPGFDQKPPYSHLHAVCTNLLTIKLILLLISTGINIRRKEFICLMLICNNKRCYWRYEGEEIN